MQSLCRRQTVALLWKLSFGMEYLAKDCFQPSVNRILLKTLVKLPTVFT